jgi:glycosyltransferase involved in cell wall biosynthesis
MLVSEKIVVVIPCLNEAATIAPLIGAVIKILPSVIVIDDGSTDGTGKLASDTGAEVLRNDSSQGKGGALNRGLQRAYEKGFEWALAMDGDGQHAPSDIPFFLNAMSQAPLIIGNRMSNPERMPSVRKIVNRSMSKLISNLTHRDLPDTQCGFRLINLNCWSQLNLQTTHFEIESELLLAFIAAGHAVEFVPVQVIYKNERSKIHPVRDTIRWLRWLRNVKRQFRIAPRNSEISSTNLSSPTTSPALQSNAKLSPP